MTPTEEKVERVLALTKRLTEALTGDIAALDSGQPSQMCSIAPETQQLVALYARETGAIKPVLKTLPSDLRARLTKAVAVLHEALGEHERRLTRVRNASEGMIRAIVEDVERKKRMTRPYAPRAAYRPAAPAMLYNGVV